MEDLDFFADLMTTGTVLGVDHTSGPAAVEEALGPGRTSPISPSMTLSDFGLVEFGRHRAGPHDDWAVSYFGAQTHRLPWLTRENLIETALVDFYGAFRPRLDLDELNTAVHARGFTLEECPSLNDDCVEYREPTSRMGVIATSKPDETGREPAGTVLKMLGPKPGSAWLRYKDRREAFKGYATHLLSLPETQRAAWLDRREPAAGPERADWWTYLRNVVARRTGSSPTTTARWRRLAIALDRHAAERGVDTEDEAALNLSISILTAKDAGLDELPTMDEAVTRWMAATPTSLAHARRLCTGRPLTPDAIRLSRRLRNQIHAIHPCLPHVTGAVATELQAWIDLKPGLLRFPRP